MDETEEAERRYPERPAYLPDGGAVVVVPLPERKAFIAGATWQASQSGVIQPDAVALIHTPEEIAAERYPPVGMQPDSDIGRRERTAFVAGHTCGWTQARAEVERLTRERNEARLAALGHSAPNEARDWMRGTNAEQLIRQNEIWPVLLPPERKEVLAVLEPFAREAGAVSLSDALGHIERAHLMAARDLVAQLRDPPEAEVVMGAFISQHMSPEPGPDCIAADTSEARAEINRLVLAVGEHVTVRGKYYARVIAAEAEVERLTREREEVLAVLEPFARHADAVSLSDALGHIERAHLMAARDLVAHLAPR